jgi:hypothetical protein
VIRLDVADLVVIAERTFGSEAALGEIDIAAARAALTEGLAGQPMRDPAAAAASGIKLVHALLRNPPFRARSQQLAVAAGLQFLSLNGWQADLDPPATVVVVEALAAGQLPPDRAAAWLSSRLSARTRPGGPGRVPASRRILVSALATIAAATLAVLATACSQGPAVTQTHVVTTHHDPGAGQPGSCRAARPGSPRTPASAPRACS